MSTSTIILGGQTVSLVAMPSSPGLRSVEFTISDAVATVESPFTGQIQAQQWPGAEKWMATLTLPPLTRAQAGDWVAFLMQLRGMANGFLLGDPLNATPLGQIWESTPVISNALNNGNPAMSEMLGTSGWRPNASGLLLPGDYIQFGYRMHRVLDNVTSDGAGNATFNIWPSLREVPVNGVAIVTEKPEGVFRLANNQRKFSFDITRLTHMSIQVQEWR